MNHAVLQPQVRTYLLEHLHENVAAFVLRSHPFEIDEFVHSANSELKLIAHCEETNKKHITELLDSEKDTLILIGPEGDFTPAEIENALEQQFAPVHLGHTRLRTETAGIYAASLFNAIIQE